MPIVYSWFVCVVPSNPCSPSSYIKITGLPICEGVEKVCAIYAQVDPNNTNRPLIPNSLCSEIAMALSNEMNTDNVKLRE